MAAYAAVVSLQHIIEKLQQQHHATHLKSLGKNLLIEAVRERAASLQDFLERYSSPGANFPEQEDEVQSLESQIADAAHAAEDILETHVVDQILAEYSSRRHEVDTSDEDEEAGEENEADHVLAKETSSSKVEETVESHEVNQILSGHSSISNDEDGSIRLDQILDKLIKDMDLINERVKKIKEVKATKDEQQRNHLVFPSSSSTTRPSTGKNSTMVGFDEYLTQIMEVLTGQGLNRQVMAIFGMGGIGKTTLAKNMYVKPLITQHFDRRAWKTISQEYSLREIFSSILRDVGVSSGEEREEKLGERLHKELSGRRYLIVLDDMWSVEAWDKVKLYFPNNNNGSRIIITTRISNLASHLGLSTGLKIGFLDDDNSWSLFCQNVFGDEGCIDPKLEELGRMITEKCSGLPLSIVTIAGLLAKSNKTPEYWEYVLENLSSIINLEENEHCFKILSLSYNHLPVHLKPCFLYMGVFPEDYKIHVSKLIKLWIAEGFLKPNSAKSIEDVAEECLHDLIGRNLVSVQAWGSRGKIKTCTVHDLLRDLCLKESMKERFLRVSDVADQDMKGQRRFAIHESLLAKSEDPELIIRALKSASVLRSVTCDISIDLPFQNFRLLRVLNNLHRHSQEDALQLFNSRYLDVDLGRGNWVLPSSINLFWNLQTVSIVSGSTRGVVILPPEIWEMRELRHLNVYDWAILPDPPVSGNDDDNNNVVLGNLQTVLTLVNFEFTEEVIRRVPSIKKLIVVCNTRYAEGAEESPCCYLNNLDRLHQLESLTLSLYNCCHSYEYWRQSFTFPVSLKKLFLDGGYLPWETITMIGVLPNLEVLKLSRDAFSGDEWNVVEGEFQSLKLLRIEKSFSPKSWNADETCFPRLERLELVSMRDLVKLPSGIGDIPTLESIYVYNCKPGVFRSAKEILEEQRSFGNDTLQVLTQNGPISLDESADELGDESQDTSEDEPSYESPDE